VHVPVNYFINSENNFLGLYLVIRFELFKSQCHVNSVTGFLRFNYGIYSIHRVADKSLVLPGRIQATATEDFDFHIAYL